MKQFCKLISGKLEEAPANYKHYINFNLDEELMRSEGFKPVTHNPDNIGDYVETETEIIQSPTTQQKVDYWQTYLTSLNALNTQIYNDKLSTVYELPEGGCCLSWLPLYIKIIQDVKNDVLDGSDETVSIPIIPLEKRKGNAAKVTKKRLAEIIDTISQEYAPFVEKFSTIYKKLYEIKVILKRNNMPEELTGMLDADVLNKVYDEKQIDNAIAKLKKIDIKELWK